MCVRMCACVCVARGVWGVRARTPGEKQKTGNGRRRNRAEAGRGGEGKNDAQGAEKQAEQGGRDKQQAETGEEKRSRRRGGQAESGDWATRNSSSARQAGSENQKFRETKSEAGREGLRQGRQCWPANALHVFLPADLGECALALRVRACRAPFPICSTLL